MQELQEPVERGCVVQQTRGGGRNNGMRRVLLIVVAFAAASGWASGQATKERHAGAPTTRASHDGVFTGFKQSETADGKPFQAAARAAWMDGVRAEVAAASRAGVAVEVVVVESVCEKQGWMTYDRAAVFRSGADGDAAGLEKRGLRRMAGDEFERVRARVDLAMKAGGSNNGIEWVGHGYEGLFVTRFDGREWRSELWHWLSTGVSVAATDLMREGIPEPMRALVDVVEFVQPYGEYQKAKFGPAVYRDMIKGHPRK
jgi:hypothetical protein